MKFTIPQGDLIDALRKSRVVLGRSQAGAVPVFGCVLIQANSERIYFVTTNGDMRLRIDVAAKVEAVGAILLPCERLISVIAPMRGEVTVSVSNKVVSLSGGPVNAKLHGLDATEFVPSQPDDPATIEFSAPCATVADWLTRVRVAMMKEPARPMLQGIHLRDQRGFLCLEAADGRRVHLIETRTEIEDIDAIIPAPAVNAMSDLLDGEGEATLSVSENRLTLSTEGMTFRSQLLNFEYPSLKPFFPDPNPEHVEVIVEAALGALDSALAIQAKDTPSVHVLASEKEITFRSDVSEVGTVDANAECRAPSPRDFRVRPEYLRDALKALRKPTAQIEVNPGRLPVAIREGGFTAVVGCMYPPVQQPQTK